MKIKKLTIDNFMAIGHVEVSLDGKGLILIQGENKDDPSQESNGAGKSTFPDALSWCAYGETARGESGDDVINEKAGKNCRVGFELDDNGTLYTIERGRKHKALKNRLHVTKHDPAGDVSLTKGTDKQTQEVVNNIMGCTADVFNAAIYAGQEKMPDLPALTDRLLKQVVEEAAGITELESAYAVARDRYKSAQGEEVLLSGELEKLEIRKKDIRDRIQNLEQRSADWEQQHKTDMQAKAKQVRKLKSEVEAIDFDRLQDEKAALEGRLKELSQHLQELDERNDVSSEQDAVAELQRKLTRVEGDLHRVLKEFKRRKHDLEHIDDKVGTKCGECGKLYEEDDLADARRIAAAEKDKIAAESRQLKKSTTGIQAKLDQALSTLDDSKSQQVSSADLADEMTSVREAYQQAEGSLRDAEQKQKDFNNGIAELKRLKGEENPNTEWLEQEQDKLQPVEDDIAKVTVHLDTAKDRTRVAKMTVDVFGPKGVRAYILDTVTPFLNERTAHYMAELSDASIEAEWSTLSVNSKGEMKEKFSIRAARVSSKRNFKSLSGGEKRKVRLACFMALQDLVSSRSSKPIELFIADEIDDALDTAGLERLMSVLNQKAKERGTVLVISHNDLRDWIRDSVTMVKEQGHSTLVSSTI